MYIGQLYAEPHIQCPTGLASCLPQWPINYFEVPTTGIEISLLIP